MILKNVLCIIISVVGLTVAQENRQCYSCNGEQCVQSLTELNVTDCGAASDKCFTIYTDYLPTKRGCVSKLTVVGEVDACMSLTDKTCSVCEGNRCNILAHEDHVCLSCSTLTDINCLTNPDNVKSSRCAATSADSSQCFVKVMGSVTERGCLNSTENVKSCLNNTLCNGCSIIYDGPSCNSYEFPENRRKCFSCYGDQCKAGKDTLNFCKSWNDTCVTFNETGNFKKGCFADLGQGWSDYCNNYPNLCLKCSSNECNKGIHYFEKTQCRSCSSANNANCIQNITAVPEVTCQSSCATIVHPNAFGKLETRRLCYESLSANEKTACDSKSFNQTSFQCDVCSTGSCNSKVFPKNRLSCFYCDKAPCNTHATVKAEICPFYKDNDKCVMFQNNGTIQSLTCLSSLNDTDNYLCTTEEMFDGLSCVSCNGTNCNDPAMYQLGAICVQCDSSINKLCSTNPGALVATPCNQTQENACYTENVGDIVKRGCLSDLTVAEQEVCNNGTANCIACKASAGCNKELHPKNRIKCHQCSSKANAACHQIDGFEPEVCDTLDKKTRCFTIFEDTGAVTRKCSKESYATVCGSGSANTCFSCPTNGCNDKLSNSGYPFEPEFVRTTLAPTTTTTTTTTTVTTSTTTTTVTTTKVPVTRPPVTTRSTTVLNTTERTTTVLTTMPTTTVTIDLSNNCSKFVYNKLLLIIVSMTYFLRYM